MRDGLAPLLEFASYPAVMRAWQAVLATAALGALAIARPAPGERLAWTAWGLAALAATGALVEALAGQTRIGTLGVMTYFVALPLMLLATLAIGLLRLRTAGRRDRLAWCLVAATPAAILLTSVLQHFPAPQVAAFALAWAASVVA